jgi:hypothetical protein
VFEADVSSLNPRNYLRTFTRSILPQLCAEARRRIAMVSHRVFAVALVAPKLGLSLRNSPCLGRPLFWNEYGLA